MPKGFKGFLKGCHPRTEFQEGENHPLWKGDKVGYTGLHDWISVHWGKARNYFCKCGKQGLDWANITGIYSRDRKNWEPMCRSCHKKFDHADTSAARKVLKEKRELCKRSAVMRHLSED